MKFKFSTLILLWILSMNFCMSQENKTTKLIFAGDIDLLHSESSKSNEADIVFATLKANVSSNTESNLNKYKDINLVLSLSSSHVTKGSQTEISHTIAELQKANINYAGLRLFQDFTTFSSKGLKYGFASFGSTPYSLTKKDSVIIKTIISRLKFKTDIVVIGYSFDSPRALKHKEKDYLEELKYFTHLCVDAGADIVFVSGYPSALPLELYCDRLIIYGQAKNLIQIEASYDGAFQDGKFLMGGNDIKELTHEYFPLSSLQMDQKGILKSNSTQPQGIAQKLLTEAAKYRGRPYKSGGSGPKQFDCSGFTSFVYRLFGFSLPHSSGAQFQMGTNVKRNELQPGDLVFFSRPATGRGVGHVGIVYSVDKTNGNFTFIHASTSRGIMIDNFSSSGYFIKRYIGAKRIFPEKRPEMVPISNDIDGFISISKKSNLQTK